MSRQNELLTSLADAFEEGRTFDGSFLREHNVSADECRDLSAILSAILTGFVSAPKEIRTALIASSVIESDNTAKHLWLNATRDYVTRIHRE